MKWLAVGIGFLAGIPLVMRDKNTQLLKTRGQVVGLCLVFSVVSVFCAMLMAGIEAMLGGGPVRIGPVSVYGVWLFAPTLLYAATKAFRCRYARLMDVYALYMLPSLVIMRCNCLYSGCCLGRLSGLGRFRWPVREIEIFFYLGMIIFLLRREKKEPIPGTAYPLLMIFYGSLRFVLEWFREGAGYFHLAHIWSILSILIGAGIYLELTNQRKRGVRV